MNALDAAKPKALRILVVGPLGPNDSSRHRISALRRLGHEVTTIDTLPYYSKGGPLLSALRFRTLIGPAIDHLNRLILETTAREPRDVVWFDKAIAIRARTVRTLRERGLYTVHFNPDNPFGSRHDPGWRLFLRALPEYDIHVVPREINLAEYRQRGARDVQLMYWGYEPTVHFAPAENWSDRNRDSDISYIGAPYDQRLEFIVELWRRHRIAVRIWGAPAQWEPKLPADAKAVLWQGGELQGSAYREGIWRSRICLAWVTHSNRDDVAHKSFEITACGGFLLAEDTPGQRAHFAAGEEAVFFRSVEECAVLIRRYLPDEATRRHISRAGRRRAETSGYGNDARMGEIMRYIAMHLTERRRAKPTRDLAAGSRR
jgi:spore maturation protein CgeB